MINTNPIPFFTFGGKQLWADEFICAGHRIQQNVVSGHHRLLDPDDVRLAWGTWDQCKERFDRLKEAKDLRVPSRHLVLLLHGVFRSKDSFGPMTRAPAFRQWLAAVAQRRRGAERPAATVALSDLTTPAPRCNPAADGGVGQESFYRGQADIIAPGCAGRCPQRQPPHLSARWQRATRCIQVVSRAVGCGGRDAQG